MSAEKDAPLVVEVRVGRAARVDAFTPGPLPNIEVVTAGVETWRTRLWLQVRASVDGSVLQQLLEEEVARMDRAASRFREDSELSEVNRRPGERVVVSAYLGDVLEAALEAAELTDGLVNPCMGDLVDAAGYRAWRDGRVPRTSTGTPVRWQEMELVRRDGITSVRIPPGSQLDVGAVAKGWLADRVAGIAAERFGGGVLANMGGDLRAVGGWIVEVDSGVHAQSLQIWDAGMATSGTGLRTWRTEDGTMAHHIIDPRTGAPAQTPWVACSVLAANGAQANAASTAAVILGDEGPDWIEQQGLDACFVAADGGIRTCGRWPDDC